MKKITVGISIFALLALAFTFVGGASAQGWDFEEWSVDATIVKNDNKAMVMNEVVSFANTGDNELKVEAEGGRVNIAKNISMSTGRANSEAGVMNQVNFNDTRISQSGDCECDEGIDFTYVNNKNKAIVANGVMSGANTGDNELKVEAEGKKGGHHGDGPRHGGFNLAKNVRMETGNANSWATAVNVVNTNITRITQ